MISVIIPVYNVKLYVRECLESVRNQSLKDFEAILVNDGSTDGSEEICREFCKADPRFHLISQGNSGLGSARNVGIEAAEGGYICFVDSDDVISRDYLRVLYDNLTNTGADISICAYKRFAGKLPEESPSGGDIRILDRIGLLDAFLKEPGDIVVAWNKLVSRKWLGNLRFENRWHEDQFMFNEYVLRCEKAVITSEPLYYYRERPDSIMGNENREDPRHADILDAVRERLRYFHTPEYEREWNALFLNSLISCMTLYFRTGGNREAVRLYNKLFREYFRMGGPDRDPYMKAKLCAFRICPKIYGRMKRLSLRLLHG